MDKWLLKDINGNGHHTTDHMIPQPSPQLTKITHSFSCSKENTESSECESKNAETQNTSSESEEEVLSKQSTGRKRIKLKQSRSGTSTSTRKSKFCVSWLDLPQMKGWLSKSSLDENHQNGNDMAFCKVCKHQILAHKSVLMKHSLSEKHKVNMKQVKTNAKLTDIYKTTALDVNVRNAEIKLCGLLTTNNLPFLLMDTLCPLLSNIFPDSQIAKHLSVKRTKSTMIVNECGRIFLKKLYNMLQQPGCFFSLVLDETTDISVKKQCAYSVIYFDKQHNEIVNTFFDITETQGGGADDLFTGLQLALQSKNIPFSNLVGFASDTPNVMVGRHHSVFSLLKNENPDIVCVKCSCHLIHLAASKACLKLPRSVEDLLRNLGSHFNRSSTRQQKFKEFQTFFQTEIHKILSPSVTRWLSLKACVDRVLEQYEPLKAYLRETLFGDPSLTTEDMLATMNNLFTKIYLEFMSYSLDLLTNFNLLFQSEKPLLHKVKPETEKLLRTLCSNYMEVCHVKKENIFNMNHQNKNHFVPLQKIYLGVQATQSLGVLKQNQDVKEKDIETFLSTIREFYIELISNIKQRFNFEDPIYNILTVIEPLNAQSFQTKSLRHIVERFPVLNEYITDLQTLDNEWRQHALLDFEILNFPTNNADQYWAKIFNLKNNADMEMFPNLKKVISMLLILPFSNASVERIFSDLFNIKTDKRNLLSTDNLKAILAMKEGIETNGGCVRFQPSKDMINAKIWHKN